jgi:hypothetical protein
MHVLRKATEHEEAAIRTRLRMHCGSNGAEVVEAFYSTRVFNGFCYAVRWIDTESADDDVRESIVRLDVAADDAVESGEFAQWPPA